MKPKKLSHIFCVIMLDILVVIIFITLIASVSVLVIGLSQVLVHSAADLLKILNIM